MAIEIHGPGLEALIRHRKETGRFSSIEDVLLQALRSAPDDRESPARKGVLSKCALVRRANERY